MLKTLVIKRLILVPGLVLALLLTSMHVLNYWRGNTTISVFKSPEIIDLIGNYYPVGITVQSSRLKFVKLLSDYLTGNETFNHLKINRTEFEMLSSDDMVDEWIRRNLFGLIWPQSTDEPNDRIEPQIEFIDVYQALMNVSGGVKKTKVLLGAGSFNMELFREGQEMFIADGCPKDWCVATRSESHYQTADAVLITQYPWAWFKPPKPPGQIWIAQHMESPWHNRINVKAVKDLVNWTASYRRESTVVMNYGTYKKAKLGQVTPPPPNKNYAANKTSLVAMLVSNCAPSSNRMTYAHELAKYITVDIYGDCGSKRCPSSLPHKKSVPCVNWMSSQYKFYLSFENSRCKDYITEKLLHNALRNDILPIVLGASREDYAAAAPPHSYIHVDDFKSPAHLAAYLKILNENDALYNEYFAWRHQWTMIDQRYWCRLCTLLHLQSDLNYVHWYRDYATWWSAVCR